MESLASFTAKEETLLYVKKVDFKKSDVKFDDAIAN